jgi:murein DD-endopeptidase MepM/ murein hydrolase activator NlpD
VIFAGYQGGYGNKVEIEYWDGTVSVYGHMSQIDVVVGQHLAPGDLVGLSGNTGHSTGPHLHLEIHPDGGSAIDPAPWLHDHGLQ